MAGLAKWAQLVGLVLVLCIAAANAASAPSGIPSLERSDIGSSGTSDGTWNLAESLSTKTPYKSRYVPGSDPDPDPQQCQIQHLQIVARYFPSSSYVVLTSFVNCALFSSEQ